MPKGVIANVALGAENDVQKIEISYEGNDDDVALYVNMKSISRNSYDGSIGNDLSTFTFPGKIEIKNKDGKGASYGNDVRCRVETGNNGMAG
jgi:hypothetical protein